MKVKRKHEEEEKVWPTLTVNAVRDKEGLCEGDAWSQLGLCGEEIEVPPKSGF